MQRLSYITTLLGLLFGYSSASAADEPAALGFRDVQSWLDSHCIRCHGGKHKKAGVDLSSFRDEAGVLKQRKLWQRVLKQLDTQEMPPVNEPQLSVAQREHLVKWVRRTLSSAEPANLAERNPGKAPMRRLTRTQYNNSLRDLFGFSFDAASAVGMPEDASGLSFDNLAVGLSLPPALMDKYFAAADKVLEQIFPFPDGISKPKNARAFDALLIVRPGKDVTPRDAARKILERFAPRAYRRPVEAREIDRLLAIFDAAQKKGESFEEAIRWTLKGVLVSPNFLFRTEVDREPKGSDKSYRVSDQELAVRLSYFLWSSQPDDKLLDLAQKGRLSDPAELEGQVKRMLADPRAHALTEGFASQWLQLRKLADARPTTEFFPTFTNRLRQAMHDEASTFFDKLREEDRSVLELLDADYTYVNEELALHYGIPGVKGSHMQRVKLRPEDRRGGLLGMAALLTLTSHTSRTSPTQRGKWILEAILGTPPAPPPPDAGKIKEEQTKGKDPQSFRELLDQHARQPSCAACHKKIDPLGFGLENYDAIGRWRDSGGPQKIDATGELPHGPKFEGPRELKQLILKRKDQFVRNMAEQTLTYALGREPQYFDDSTLRTLTEQMERDNYRFSTLILGIVRSFPFQYRRNSDASFD
jgi:mono/diheme cytochrome c family protein